MPRSAPIVRFGPFQVLSRIGIGGMGEVFHARARLPSGAVEVALKLIRPEFADDHRYRDMFLAEAEIGGLLDHPNIARVVASGQVGGVLYLATELIEGISLTGLTVGPVPPVVTGHIVGCLLDALAYVHERRDDAGRPLGLVHRDVSPSNVLLSRAGNVKLTDFGVHKVAGALRTQPGELKGKPAFMAPEQLPGGGDVDRRADLFAVGVILHMLALGRAPFSDVGAWLVQGAPLDLDGPLAEVIAHALAADREQRVATARELADELAYVLPGDAAAALLGRLVSERARPERPIGAIERLIMSELEPALSSSLVYAPDPSTDRLFVVAGSESNPLDSEAALPDLDDNLVTKERLLPRDPLRNKPSLPPLAATQLLPTATVPPPALELSSAPTVLETIRAQLRPMPSAPVARIPLAPETQPRSRRTALSILLVGGVTLGATVIGVQLFPTREIPVQPLTAESAPANPPREPVAAPPAAEAQPPVAAPPPVAEAQLPVAAPPPVAVAAHPPSTDPPAEASAPSERRPPAATAPRTKPKPRVTVEPPPERPTGYLTLDTDPWATVYIGPRKLGTTPFMRAPLPAGHYKLVLDVKNSGERIERTVDIAPGEVKRLALRLR